MHEGGPVLMVRSADGSFGPGSREVSSLFYEV